MYRDGGHLFWSKIYIPSTFDCTVKVIHTRHITLPLRKTAKRRPSTSAGYTNAKMHHTRPTFCGDAQPKRTKTACFPAPSNGANIHLSPQQSLQVLRRRGATFTRTWQDAEINRRGWWHWHLPGSRGSHRKLHKINSIRCRCRYATM
jgi:hypothetical protein